MKDLMTDLIVCVLWHVTQVVKVDALKKKVYLDNGAEIGYDKCLIATGELDLLDLSLVVLSPFLIGRAISSSNRLQTVQWATFLDWAQMNFQFHEHSVDSFMNCTSFFNWLIIRCKLQPELAAQVIQTWSNVIQNVG